MANNSRQFSVNVHFKTIDDASKTIDKINKSLKNLTMPKMDYSKSSQSLINLANANNKNNIATKKHSTLLDQLRPRLSNHVEGLGNVAVTLNGLTAGITLAANAAVSLGKSLGEAVKGAGNIEMALVEVSNVTGKTGDELQILKEIAVEVGEASKFTTREMLNAQRNLGQLGLITAKTTTEAIKEMTQTIADYAVATNQTIEIASRDVSALNQALDEPIGEIADKMVWLANNTQIAYKDMQNFSKFGGLVKGMNQNTDSLLSLTAAYRKFTPSTRLATTHIVSFGNAVGSVLKNQNKMAEMRTIAEAIGKTNIITDANGDIRDMVDIINDLQKSYTALGYTQEQIQVSLRTMFNARAVGVYMGAVGEGIETIRSERARMQMEAEGGLRDMSQQMADTFNGLIARIGGILENMRDRIGEYLLPEIKEIAKSFIDTLNSIDIEQLASFISTAVQPVFNAFERLVPLLNDKIIPIIMDITERSTPIIETITDIIETITPHIADLISQLTPLITIIGEVISTVWKGLKPVIDNILTLLIPAIGEVVNLFNMVWDAVKPIADVFFTMLNDSINPIVSELLPIFVDSIKTISTILKPILSVISSINKIVSPMLTMITKLLGKKIGADLKLIGLLLQGIGKSLEPIVWLIEKATQGFEMLADQLSGVSEVFEDGFFKVFDEGFNSMFGKVGEFFGIIDNTNEKMKESLEPIFGQEQIEKSESNLTKFVTNAGDIIGKAFKGLSNAITEYNEQNLLKMLTKVDNVYAELETKIEDINNKQIQIGSDMGKASETFYKETSKQLEEVVMIEEKIADKRAEIRKDWQSKVMKAEQGVFEAQKKLEDFRSEWYDKQAQKIADLNDKIAMETEEVMDDMLKPRSILESEFETLFDGLSTEHFKDQLFDDLKSVENQIGDGLSFLEKAFTKDIQNIYSKLEQEVAKETDKLFKTYLSDEELYVFGDLESRKEAIKNKFPSMANDIFAELDDVAQKAKIKTIKDLTSDVNLVDDSKLKQLEKDKSDLMKMNIKEDKQYQKLAKSVDEYQDELEKISSEKFLEELIKQDKTLQDLEGQYADLTSQLSLLNVNFNALNSNFEKAGDINEYMNSLEDFIMLEIDKTNLSTNQDALSNFMNMFSSTTSKNSISNLTIFQKTLTELNTTFGNLAGSKENAEEGLKTLVKVRESVMDGNIQTAIKTIFEDTSGFFDDFNNVIKTGLGEIEGFKKAVTSFTPEDLKALSEPLKEALSDGNVLDDFYKSLQDKVSKGLLTSTQASELFTSFQSDLNLALQDGLTGEELNTIWEEAGKKVGEMGGATMALTGVKALDKLAESGLTGSYLASRGVNIEEFLNDLNGAYTGGFISNLANPILNGYDNTVIKANPNEFLLRENTTNKLINRIGKDGLEHFNRTGEMPDYFKHKDNTNTHTEKKEVINNSTYKTTINLEDKRKHAKNKKFETALYELLREI